MPRGAATARKHSECTITSICIHNNNKETRKQVGLCITSPPRKMACSLVVSSSRTVTRMTPACCRSAASARSALRFAAMLPVCCRATSNTFSPAGFNENAAATPRARSVSPGKTVSVGRRLS